MIDGRGGADTMRGDAGNDIYHVDNSGDLVIELAGEGSDEVRSTVDHALADNVEALTLLAGATYGYGNESDNRITGNDSANTLYGMGGADFIVGGAGDDTLIGGTGGDHLDGGAGNDVYHVDNALDFVFERTDGGTDTVYSAINYQLSLELENLTLADGAYVGMGNYRDNRLTGNAFDNVLTGKEGNDSIDGGMGNDRLNGGLGADSFVFTTAIVSQSWDAAFTADGMIDSVNTDTIEDFTAGVDRILLDDAVFTGLTAEALAAGFAVGSLAADADDRIIYDPATGALIFDVDGIGGTDAIHFATVGTNLSLSAADFGII